MAQRTAIITGAGQGMGRAIALRLASEGIHVILAGRTRSKLEAVAEEVQSAGGEATVAEIDLEDAQAIQSLASDFADTVVDILVNCAGDWLIKTIEETTTADLDHILDINLKAPYLMSRSFVPQLRRSENASIINIGSLAAVNSFPGITAYTAAKTGLRGLTGSLAAELRDDLIRVMMLSPGPANTPMRWDASPDIDPQMLVEPETIAELVALVVNLPKGITTSDVVLESMRLEF